MTEFGDDYAPLRKDESECKRGFKIPCKVSTGRLNARTAAGMGAGNAIIEGSVFAIRIMEINKPMNDAGNGKPYGLERVLIPFEGQDSGRGVRTILGAFTERAQSDFILIQAGIDRGLPMGLPSCNHAHSLQDGTGIVFPAKQGQHSQARSGRAGGGFSSPNVA